MNGECRLFVNDDIPEANVKKAIYQKNYRKYYCEECGRQI